MRQFGSEEQSAAGRSIDNDLSIEATNARSPKRRADPQEAFIQALKVGIEKDACSWYVPYQMTHDARGIANIFLAMAESKGRGLTSMALLKILYFAHAWHLAKYREPLVGQKFEAWKHGPVSRVVYDQVKRFGSGIIEGTLQKLDLSSGEYVSAKSDVNNDTYLFLGNVFDYYSEFHPYKLSDITHEKDTPWDMVWGAAEKNAVPGMLIPDELILEWFEKTGGRLYRSGERGVNT